MIFHSANAAMVPLVAEMLAHDAGAGTAIRDAVAGFLAKRMGDNFTFLVLAGIAAFGLAFFWLLMPETHGWAGTEEGKPEGGEAVR